MFNVHLQTRIIFLSPCLPNAYHIHVEKRVGSSPTGCLGYGVNSSSPSNKCAAALGSSSSHSLLATLAHPLIAL